MKVAMPLSGAVPARLPAGTALTWRGVGGAVRSVSPGVAMAGALALAAGWIAGGLGDPLARNPVLVAMLFGLLIGNIFVLREEFRPGLDFTKRYLLRLAVVLAPTHAIT